MNKLSAISIVFIMSILAASPTFKFDFVGDDSILVTENKDVQEFKIRSIFTRDFFERDISGVPVKGKIGYFRPLTKLSLAVDWRIWGNAPFGYHLSNALIHAATAILLCLLAMNLGLATATSTMLAVLFSTYASHPEALALINARSDLLCTFGFALACIGYILYSIPIVLIATFISVFSKETGIFVPFLGLILLWCKDNPLRSKKIHAGAFGVVGFYFVWRAFVSHAGNISEPTSSIDGAWLMYALKSIGVHTFLLLAGPSNLPSHYILPISWLDPYIILGIISLSAAATSLVLFLRKRDPMAAFVFWLSIGFLPYTQGPNIQVPFAGQLIPVQGRWTYLPAAAICLLIGNFLFHRFEKKRDYLIFVLTCTLLLPLYWVRLQPYSSGKANSQQWVSTIARIPSDQLSPKVRAHFLGTLGTLLAEQGDLGQGISHMLEAKRLNPGDSLISVNLGAAYLQQKNFSEAEKYLKESLQPKMVKKSGDIAQYIVEDHQLRDRSNKYALLGFTLSQQGKYEEAAKIYEHAINADANNPTYFYNLGICFAKLNKKDAAIAAFQKAHQVSPCYAPAILTLQQLHLAPQVPPTCNFLTGPVE